jgi:hypothetical protein
MNDGVRFREIERRMLAPAFGAPTDVNGAIPAEKIFTANCG